MNGWIGVDLDGTLASYDGWKGIDNIGPPVEWARQYVLELLDLGVEVRIVTARVQEGQEAIDAIETWCNVYLGQILPVTDKKDMSMVALIDDRAFGPKSWFELPPAGKFSGLAKWHHSPENPDNPANTVTHDTTV